MAISRDRKEELLTEYRQQMAKSAGVMLATYSGMTVAQMQDLRHRARGVAGEVFVVKNTLLGKVLAEQGVKLPESLTMNPTIAAFCHKDVPSVARLFRDYVREVEEGKFVIKGGVIEGYVLNAEQAVAAGDLPTREQALSLVLRTINAPASQTVGVIASGIRQVINVIKAYADKLGESGAPAEAAA